ncbi:unnamed protein product [Cuscuta campestris]|uniref:Uncharacterized protein n=1 Tax=Cuscuta campestris TaxID=132261 RepID=A0A484LHX0_9ASTE|nr:unnamed protein product [Cuscuta campestris]
MRHDSRLVFTLLGLRHSITVAELGWRLGLYTQEETQHHSFADLPISVPDDFDIQAFWAAHSRTDAPFEHQISHSSDWTEPSWRALTFVMSMSYFGRPSNSNRVYSTDMLFFWSLANRRPINLAVFVARFLWAQTYGTRLTFVCGPLVTLLHKSLQEHLPIPDLLPLEQSFRLLDTTMLTHIHLQRGQTRRIRPRAETMPRPEAMLHPTTIHEQGSEPDQSSTTADSQTPLWAQSMMHQMNRIQTQIQGIQLQFGEQMNGLQTKFAEFETRFSEFETRFTEFENRYEGDMVRLFE